MSVSLLTPRSATRPRLVREPGDVFLVSPPFGRARSPSLGLSLLKAELHRKGISATVLYLNVQFAREIGWNEYERISVSDEKRFLGEWIFYAAMWGSPSAEVEEAYWSTAFPDQWPLWYPSFATLKTRVSELQRCAADFVDRSAASVEWKAASIVGFSTVFQQNLASLALARRIKDRSPNTAIVFGGANCEAEMGRGILAAFPFVDVVFSGEADGTFPPFVADLRAGRPVVESAGVLTRHRPAPAAGAPSAWVSTVNNLDELPYPDFDDFFQQFKAVGPRTLELPFETSRGCWWGARQHCTFCGLNGSTMAFRRKSPDRAVDEVRHLLGCV